MRLPIDALMGLAGLAAVILLILAARFRRQVARVVVGGAILAMVIIVALAVLSQARVPCVPPAPR